MHSLEANPIGQVRRFLAEVRMGRMSMASSTMTRVHGRFMRDRHPRRSCCGMDRKLTRR